MSLNVTKCQYYLNLSQLKTPFKHAFDTIFNNLKKRMKDKTTISNA